LPKRYKLQVSKREIVGVRNERHWKRNSYYYVPARLWGGVDNDQREVCRHWYRTCWRHSSKWRR